jgi:hypothetical protein
MLLGQQMVAGRVLESLVPILFVLVMALEYAGSARRHSRRSWTAA